MISNKDIDAHLAGVLELKKLPVYVDCFDENYKRINKSKSNSKTLKDVTARSNKAGYYCLLGEDIVLQFMIDKLNLTNGHCMEFGARTGIAGSNILYLCKNGYTGLMIEASDRYFKVLKKNMAKYPNVICDKRFITCEENTVDDILEEHKFPTDMDLISIDIDSNDYWVWKSMKKYKPKIVIIEFNPSFKESFTIEYNPKFKWKKDYHYGATAPALYKLGLEKGYDLVYIFPYNLVFIDKDVNNGTFEALDIQKVDFYWRKDQPSSRKDIKRVNI
jgi:hypothetical protein